MAASENSWRICTISPHPHPPRCTNTAPTFSLSLTSLTLHKHLPNLFMSLDTVLISAKLCIRTFQSHLSTSFLSLYYTWCLLGSCQSGFCYLFSSCCISWPFPFLFFYSCDVFHFDHDDIFYFLELFPKLFSPWLVLHLSYFPPIELVSTFIIYRSYLVGNHRQYNLRFK